MTDKKCPVCKEPFTGRTNKVFCSINCRNKKNNSVNYHKLYYKAIEEHKKEIAKLRINHQKEIDEFETNCRTEILLKTKEIRDEVKEEVEILINENRILDYERNRLFVKLGAEMHALDHLYSDFDKFRSFLYDPKSNMILPDNYPKQYYREQGEEMYYDKNIENNKIEL